MYNKHLEIDVDRGIDRTIIAKQGDTHSRFLVLRLIENGNLIDLTGKTVRVYAIKPDGTKIFNDCVITPVSAPKGIATLELTSQMLAIPGQINMELMILKGTDKLTTVSFFITVKQSLNGDGFIESANEFGALIVALNRLDTYDATINTLISNWDAKFKTKYDGLNAQYAADLTKAKQDITTNANNIAKNITDINTVTELATYLNALVYNAMQPYTNLKERLDNIENKDVGLIGYFADVVPAGWLECNGQEILKTTYPILFARIGTKYGESTDRTKFKLPDLRGQFLRCANTTASGIDSGRTVGSTQTDAIKAHGHGLGSGQLAYSGSGYTATGKILVSPGPIGGGSPNGVDVSTFGTTETRPANIALLACIKY
ncbi:MAG: tail fiber protein [Filifactoraceae bacterium]